MKASENGKGYSLEATIFDEHGRKVFHYRPGKGNVRIGVIKTNEFVQKELGIPIGPDIARVEAKINNVLSGRKR